jgi:hypothetical protein
MYTFFFSRSSSYLMKSNNGSEWLLFQMSKDIEGGLKSEPTASRHCFFSDEEPPHSQPFVVVIVEIEKYLESLM